MRTNNESSLGRGGRALAVIAAHVLVIYVIATGLGAVPLPKFVQPMQAVIIDQPNTAEPVKTLNVKPKFDQPAIDVPEPPVVDVPIDDPQPDTAPTNAISTSDAPEASNLKVTRRVDPAYPPASRRGGEQGSGVFRVLVDERGRPGDVQVLKSTGFARLDQAAMEAIRRWVFAAAMRDGQPVTTWTRVQVTFRLNQ